MISARTGAVAVFRMLREIRSRNVDNELQGWVFGPTHASVQAQPDLRGVTVTIFND
jgi:hypothetical protein